VGNILKTRNEEGTQLLYTYTQGYCLAVRTQRRCCCRHDLQDR